MNQSPAKDTHAKALALNLDPSIYGSFAEIGGGQEVARWFLTVGGASGTIAQTISAYDKAFSDHTYGAGTRYVSRERVLAMLDHEFALVVDRLSPTRGSQTRFFAFANTVATRNYKGDNEQHGWIGLRFQIEPGGKPSDLFIHVNLRDPTTSQQQDALGVIGVNLLHAAYFARASMEQFLESIWDGLAIERMEIDVLDYSGPAFAGSDPRASCLQLLRRKMSRAIVFDRNFQAVEPSSILRKRPLLIDRGRFETVEPFHAAMLESAGRALRKEGIELSRDPQALLELALHPAMDDDAADDATLLARIRNMLNHYPAMVTDMSEMYRLVPYLRRYTAEPIRIVVGVSLLARILQSSFYSALPGSLLEGMGRLFASNVSLYAYPMPREAVIKTIGTETAKGNIRIADSATGLVHADDLILEPPSNHLYRYLRETGHVMPIEPA